MSTPPWEADRALTRELAASTIRELFPTVDASELRLLGSGWEFDVYVTRDGWVFRFPRRAHCAELFGPEQHVHWLVASVLPSSVAIPRVELSGRAAKGFPYEVAGHRLIAGVSANAVDPSVLPTMARSMGEALSCIHAIPESDSRAAGVGERPLDDENVIRWFERGMRAVSDRHWPDEATRRAVDWVGEQKPPFPQYQGTLRFTHYDLGPDHLIVDPETGDLAGIIDWTFPFLGDPASDFVALVHSHGWGFVEDVLRHYSGVVDPLFRVRLRFSARILSVMWLAAAVQRDSDLDARFRHAGRAA